jgi:hypothetical protein
MKKRGAVRSLLNLTICALAFPLSDASALSQDDNSENIAKEAMKLPESQLTRIQPSPKYTTFSGNATGYGSGLRYRGASKYVSMNPLRVLMIGDSMTVGGFGEAMQAYLLQRFGINKFAVYASCGSSPEHWMRSGPNFITKCGYREQTPSSSILYDSQNGRQPQEAATPKLEDLVARFQPATVIVQLGTNWMDGMAFESAISQSAYSKILDRFVAAVHSEPNAIRGIIWITPPDSSHYSSETQRMTKDLIKNAARRNSFEIIDSESMTHYVPGKSGSDGIHYNSEEAKEWANRVARELDRMLR